QQRAGPEGAVAQSEEYRDLAILGVCQRFTRDDEIQLAVSIQVRDRHAEQTAWSPRVVYDGRLERAIAVPQHDEHIWKQAVGDDEIRDPVSVHVADGDVCSRWSAGARETVLDMRLEAAVT